MSTALQLHFTYDAYLAALRESELKLEFWSGVIYAMAGGTLEHGALTSKVMALLDAKLPASCRTFSSDVKVRIESSDVTVFPDGSVVCGAVERARGDRLAIVNPGLIVEVTSPSTYKYDLGKKLEQYKRLRSVHTVWLIGHEHPSVRVVERHAKGWRSFERGAGQQLVLRMPALTIDVDAIYRAIEGL